VSRGIARLAAPGAGYRILRHRRSAWLIFGVTLVVTALAWRISAHGLDTVERERFHRRAAQIQNAIRERVDEYELALRGAVGLFAASERVTRGEWRRYVESLGLDRQYPGVLGIGFAARIPAPAREAHEAAVRAEGFATYAIWPAGARAEYSSIVFLEPFTGVNLAAFGYDMSTERIRRAAMDAARDSGHPMLSGRVTLIQDGVGPAPPGVLLYLPVYAGGAIPATIAERRAQLLGFVCSPFRVRDVMEDVVGAVADVAYAVHDGEQPVAAALLHAGGARHRDGAGGPDRTDVTTLVVAGRPWTVSVAARARFLSAAELRQPTLIAIGGLGIDLLLLVTILSLVRLEGRARELASLRTAELERANQALSRQQAALEDNQVHLKAAIETKEMLLKEVHHRVKNNLQVVSSLIGFDAERAGASAQVLHDAQARIRAVAVLHEKLYRSGQLGAIAMDEYLHEACEWLASHRSAAGGAVDLAVDAGAVRLGIDQAMPCGLIAHELLTNALKHAFPAGRAGKVRVAMTVDGGRVELLVADDGVGLPAGFDLVRSDSLGLQIVQALVTQLGGRLELASACGVVVTVTFPLIEPTAGSPALEE
jgi:two-component sensor histidine kinase/CHASE1-domain containing sensor protein